MRIALLAGLLAVLSYADTNYKKVTICASGCDYDTSQLQQALQDAADYQAATCRPYLIEGTAIDTLATAGNFTLPPKTCPQYVEIRSSGGPSFTPATRYKPATDDAKAFTIAGSGGNAMFITHETGTSYWRFRNIKFTTTGAAAYSAFIQWGQSYTPSFSLSNFVNHLEVIQCAMIGRGQNDVYTGLTIVGDNVRIVDSHIANITKLSSDSQAISIISGKDIEIRNNYLSALDETLLLGGGSILPSGILAMFMRVDGNKLTKEPWMNHTHAAGAPTKPCWQGNWYTNDTTNDEYLCTAVSGVWTLQGAPLPYVHRNMKNMLETKAGLGFRILGNSMGPMAAEAAQDPTFVAVDMTTQPVGDGVSNPHCSTLQPCDRPQPWTTASDAWIEGNWMRDGFSSFALGAPAVTSWDGYRYHFCADDPAEPCYERAQGSVRFRHNLVSNISDERNYCMAAAAGRKFPSDGPVINPTSGDGYCTVSIGAYGATGPLNFVGGNFDVDLSHNTHSISTTTPNSGQFYLIGYAGMTAGKHINFSDNIVNNKQLIANPTNNRQNGCALYLFMNPALAGSLVAVKNVFTDEHVNAASDGFAMADIGPTCRTDGNYYKWTMGNAYATSAASILDSNFRVTAGGTSCDGGTCKNWGSDGRDPGADIDLVTWRTAHAEDGAPAPALDYAIRSVIPTPGHGAKIYFTAPSASACTWEMSTNPGSYASPIAVSSQTRTGRAGLAIWNGTLTAGVAYWARATCDGMKLEAIITGHRAYMVAAP